MPRTHSSLLLLAAAAWGALVPAGCASSGPEMPQTYPVTGKVVYKGGKAWTAGGSVQFRSRTDAEVVAIGEIQKDGTFSVTTYRGGKSAAGAAEGEYEVTVIPPQGPEQTEQPIVLPRPYKVEPRDNSFTIEVDPPRRSP